MIEDSFNKVTEISLHQSIDVNGIKIKPYYAGHVLGAAMFYIKVEHLSVVYTGDYNMTPDSHLGGAWIDRCKPDVLITESTYATTVRESRRSRENDMLNKVHKIVANGGKVLIPVFALGRAQEICLLLERYWEDKNLTVPIYMSKGMAENAVKYYKLFISWTNQAIKENFYKRNFFHFKRTLPLETSVVDKSGPMVVLASPGMLHAGMSCYIFKKWAADPKNALLLPGYCAIGTLGHKVLAGQTKIPIEDDSNQCIEVNLQVLNMSFSAHADSNGIFQLIDFCRPKVAVILVHGEASGMRLLSDAIRSEFDVNCYYPNNGEVIDIKIKDPPVKAYIATDSIPRSKVAGEHRFHGVLKFEDDSKFGLRIEEHESAHSKGLMFSTSIKTKILVDEESENLKSLVEELEACVSNAIPSATVTFVDVNCFYINSFWITVVHDIGCDYYNIDLRWNYLDNDCADVLLSALDIFVAKSSDSLTSEIFV